VDVAPGWDTYRSERFAVSFRYPLGWQLDAVHGGEAYRGEDGYFILDAMGSGGATIDALAADQVNHHLLPFGTDPSIEELELGGQEARLILPAADASMGDQALLIVRYPQPVTIQGTAYDHFALYADEAHIRTIAQTLQFTSSTGAGAPSRPWKGLVYQSHAVL
jgi:TolB protein